MSRSTRIRAASSPMRSCSRAAIGPSSAMGPSTAIRWPSPAIHRAARSAAAIDSGLALYASLTTRTPAGVVNVSIRHCDTTACDKASAHANERHAERDAGGRGGQRVRDHVLAGDGQRHRRALDALEPGGTTRTRPLPATRPRRGRRRRARARTSPPVPRSCPRTRRRPDRRRSGSRRRRNPTPRSAPRRPRRSAPRNRTPPGARRRRSSRSRCRAARSRTGSRRRPRGARPSPRRPPRYPAAAPSSVTGRPTSLLNDSGLACVRNLVAEHRGRHVLRGGLAVGAR